MGQIYAVAKEVISSLETDRDIAALFVERPDDWRTSGGLYALSRSPYWHRAWISQEIILDSHVKLMADVHMLPLDVLPPYHTAMAKRRIYSGMRKTRLSSYENTAPSAKTISRHTHVSPSLFSTSTLSCDARQNILAVGIMQE
jgi:hypothetical protein